MQTAPMPERHPATAREFLVVRIGDDECGIAFDQVVDLLRADAALWHGAGLHGTADFYGTPIAAIDLRRPTAPACAQQTANSHAALVVVRYAGAWVGLMVNGVSGMESLAPNQIVPIRDVHGCRQANHLQALGVIGQQILLLLDIEEFLSACKILAPTKQTVAPAQPRREPAMQE